MSGQEPSSGMSTGLKIVLIIVISSGVCVMLCCGGGYFFFRNAVTATDKPAEILEMQESIVVITVPQGYEPASGVSTSMAGFTMKIAAYHRDGGKSDGELMLMQMKFPGPQSDAEIQRSFEMQMDQMGQSQELSIEESETRTFMIDDQEIDFLFVTGSKKNSGDAGGKVKQVQGVFPGRNGTTMLMLIETEENWDEAAIVKMIESITVSEDGVPETNGEVTAEKSVEESAETEAEATTEIPATETPAEEAAADPGPTEE